MGSRRKRILVFIDWFLPGYRAGGPIRSVANMIEKTRNEFDYFVVTRDKDYCEEEPYPNVDRDAWNKRENGLWVYYATERGVGMKMIRERIMEVEPDKVYINGLFSYYFSILPLFVTKNHLPRSSIIVASRGMLSESAIGVKKMKKRFFLGLGKLIGLYKGVVFHATNQKEAQEIKGRLGERNVRIAPNLPGMIDQEGFVPKKKTKGNLKLLNVARVAPEKNTLYLLQLLKDCNCAHIKLNIFGPVYDRSYWNACKEVIDTLPARIEVNYRGSIDTAEIPESIRDHHATILPSRGENFGHSIQESFLAGRPMIISDQTPWRDLEKKGVGWDIPLDRKELFIKAIDELCEMGNDDFDRLARNAYAEGERIRNDQSAIEANKELFN